MPEPYAIRVIQDGSKIKYWRKADYQRARFQASGTAAAQRARINRAVGGPVL